MELPKLNNKGITLSDLEEIVNKLEPLEKEVNAPLPDKQLLSKQYYDSLFNNYIEYMSSMLNK